MTGHHTIQMFTREWFTYTAICIAAAFFILILCRKLTENGKRYLRIFLGIITFASAIFIHPYLFHIGQWTVQSSLPLHMCQLSEICAAIVLIWPNQRLFEILCYWGISGGIHSILTPELLYKVTDGFLLFNYYYRHTVIILVPLLLMTKCNMRLSSRSWLKVFVFTNLCVPVIGTVNVLTGSNYMYLAEKPVAHNPLLIGDWPWYILVLDIAALAHYYVIYLVCTKKIKIPHPILKAKTTNV